MNKTTSEILANNEYLRDIHKGQRCFIIGNGPSINTQDLTLLKNDIVIVVNSFFHHKDAAIVNPKYWVIADPLYWGAPEIALYKDYEKFLSSKISIKLFAPIAAKKEFSRTITSTKASLHYYGFDSGIPIENKIDFTKIIPGLAQNVVIISLMLSFYLGCNPIYLVGCDHDFFTFSKEQFIGTQIPHFYEEFSDYKDSDNMSWEWFQHSRNVVKEQYTKIVRYKELFGYEIYNATDKGYLDHFPRVNYESLF